MDIGNNCRRICLSTNTSCNLNCKYCYESKDKSRFSVDRAFQWLSNILSDKTDNGTRIKLHGGEPFLIFDALKELCEKLWAANFPEEFIIHMTTNGTLIHGEIQQWLRRYRNHLNLKLSIDGGETIHNLNRPESFKNIDFDFFTQTWPDINIKMTISPWTINQFFKAIIQIYELGFKNILPSFAEMVEWPEDVERIFYLELSKLSKFYEINPRVKRCSLYDVEFYRIFNTTTQYHPCTIGVKEAYDYITDRTYPCHFFFESTAGKEKSKEMLEIDLSDKRNRISSICESCKFLNLCHTCYAANYLYRGATYERDPIMCKLQKIQFLSVAEFEYNRILALDKMLITSRDVRQMKAISLLLRDFKNIKKRIKV